MGLQGKASDAGIVNDPPVCRRHKMDRDRIERLRSENWVPLTDSCVKLEPVAVSAEFHLAVKVLAGAAAGLAVGFLISQRR